MRQTVLNSLRSGKIFDLLVVGGGATGCGIALDAATRGLSVALVERFDFAEGTSSRSTKLVHGGVRYLEAAVKRLDRDQYSLVRHALHERGAFLRNAPHLTNRLPLVTPVYSWWQLPYVYAGLKLYDLLSGNMNIGHSSVVGRKEALRRFPMLKVEGLKAGVIYYDGQFVDSRMNVTLAMTARREGACLANHVEVTGLLHDDSGQVAGAHVRDGIGGQEWDIRARAVINATGPFADTLRRMDDPQAQPILKVSSGIHIMLDRRFVPPETGLLIPQTDDGRVLFILPWQGHAIVGTTDEKAEISAHPTPSPADVAYLLSHVRRYFNIDVSESDIKSVWSGIRPLVFDPKAKDTAQLARDHVIINDPSGLTTISGGKWTTYRFMAEQAVDHVVARAGLSPTSACRTHDMVLLGGEAYVAEDHARLSRVYGIPEDVAHHLNRSYGDRASQVALIAAGGFGDRLNPGHPYIEAEVLYVMRHEAAERATDVLCRRLTMALVDVEAAKAAAPRVIDLMAAEAGWPDTRRQQEMDFLRTRLTEAL